MLEFLKGQLKTLLEERGALQNDLDAVLVNPTTEKRDLSPEEAQSFSETRAKLVAKDAEIDQMEARVRDAEQDEARAKRVAEVRAQYSPQKTERPSGGAAVTSEARTYEQWNQRNISWVRDMFTVGTNGPGRAGAEERLERNQREVALETRALTTTDGAGGDFVPPVWFVNQFVELARAARPVADRVQNMQLPGGTDTFSVPKLLTGTAVAQQATQNTTVQITDATTGSVSVAVVTLAGGQTISQQLIDQSPINIDDILLRDLTRDYATKVDVFVLNNNATNAKGLLQQTGTTAQTYTDASPTTPKLYSQIAQAISGVAQVRFEMPDTIVMSPRRWAAFQAAVDSGGRPFMAWNAGQAYNPLGSGGGGVQGVVGQIQGLPVIVDTQIPTNLGAGTNQDPVIVMKADDAILWEGTVRAEAFRETKADSLSVFLRLYNYVAFTAGRYAPSVAIINGTGLVPPTYGS
jgi:HK97 family phage major capsid protein